MNNYYLSQEFLININNALQNCNKCVCYNTRGGSFLSHNTNKLDLFFIAQNPGFSWWNKQVKPEQITPFALDDDKNRYHYFFDVIRKIFVRKFNREPIFYITNILKCVTYKNSIPDDMTINTCVITYLKKELEYFKYDYIITLGVLAEKVMQSIGNYKFIPLFHPGYLNRQGKKYLINYTYAKIKEVYKWKK